MDSSQKDTPQKEEDTERETLFDRWTGNFPICFDPDPEVCREQREKFLQKLLDTYI